MSACVFGDEVRVCACNGEVLRDGSGERRCVAVAAPYSDAVGDGNGIFSAATEGFGMAEEADATDATGVVGEGGEGDIGDAMACLTGDCGTL